MEDLQTDTLSDYGKNQNTESTNKDSENACAATLLNGCEEIDDPLDLMDNCDNASIGSNSDVWKGSDSEDDCFDNKGTSQENVEADENMQPNPTDEMNETQPDGQNIIEPESKEEEKNAEPTTQDDNKGKQILESEHADEDNSVIESEEQNTRQEPDAPNDQVEESEKLTHENKESEQDVPNNNDKEEAINPEEKETDVEEKETNVAEETETNHAEEKETNLAEEKETNLAEEKENNVAEEKGTQENNEESSSAMVNTQEENVDISTTENVDNSTPEIVKEKDKEADPLTDTVEKDPLASDDIGKDPLNNEDAEKDPLNVCSAEQDPLAGDGYSMPSRRPDRNNDGQDDDESQIDYNEDDYDFDPSLLCPEVSMAVDESPVITNCGLVPNDGTSSPLPYEPLFSTYVDDVTGAEISFNLTPEEQELRRRLYGPTNPVQITKIHCTACNVHLGSALEGQNNRFVHPLLKVLICKECYHFYTSGEFEKDEDGSELYCRWCGQGGQVLCCSKCEYVFCKRCIRTNFGRKKMFEIRDSDSWDCFRCSPGQLITQRIACFEFFEYVRREISRASALNEPEIWSKDHTRCCNKEKKKVLENGEEPVKKSRKRKAGEVDPDYSPIFNNPMLLPGQQVPSLGSSQQQQFSTPKGVVLPKPVQILHRSKSKDNDIEFVRHIPAPQVALNPINRPGTSGQYRTILPSNVRPVMQPPSLVRINSQKSQPMPPLMPTGRLLNSALQGRSPTAHMMKHEWFEKTVRAAARVNSHLSYTLTQLNKAQSQAASVEELAVVHNKLQEILSSSINSLIQIRKNLRTEFIAGIKTVRLPSKKVDSFANDDDVIFVSAPSTIPSPSTSQAKNVQDPIIIIDKSNKSTPTANSNSASTNINETTSNVIAERPKGGYLKVKSVLELQNVPSECITIPDDTPTPSSQVNDMQKQRESPIKAPEVIVCNGLSSNEATTTADSRSKTPDPLSITPEPPSKPREDKNKTSDSKRNAAALEGSPKGEPPLKKTKIDTHASTNEATRDSKSRRSKERLKKTAYNLKEEPSPEIKRMLSVTVKLPKVDLEDIQKRLPNGCH